MKQTGKPKIDKYAARIYINCDKGNKRTKDGQKGCNKGEDDITP